VPGLPEDGSDAGIQRGEGARAPAKPKNKELARNRRVGLSLIFRVYDVFLL